MNILICDDNTAFAMQLEKDISEYFHNPNMNINVVTDHFDQIEGTYDVIFMDPPYGRQLERAVMNVLSDKEFVTDTLIVIEASLDEDFGYLDSMGFEITKEKKYKTNKHVFVRKRIEE